MLLQSYFSGLGTTASLIMAIGSQNAFVLHQSLRREHHLLTALLCVLCDTLLISLGLLGLTRFLAQDPQWKNLLQWGGCLFLAVYGLRALHRALSPQALEQDKPTRRNLQTVILTALSVSLLNPHAYVDTLLLIGSVGLQQPRPEIYALGAISASALWFGSLALAGAHLSPWLSRPQVWRCIDLAVALLMFSLAWQLLTPDR